jgi:hypothetical protein
MSEGDKREVDAGKEKVAFGGTDGEEHHRRLLKPGERSLLWHRRRRKH